MASPWDSWCSDIWYVAHELATHFLPVSFVSTVILHAVYVLNDNLIFMSNYALESDRNHTAPVCASSLLTDTVNGGYIRVDVDSL